MRITGQHWTLAFSVALIAHAGVAAAVLWEPPPSGAQSAGLGGIEVSLGPSGGAPGDVAAPASMPEAENLEPPDAVAEPRPEETVEDAPEPEVAQPPEQEQTELAETTDLTEPVTPPSEMPEPVLEGANPPVPEPLEAAPLEPAPDAVEPPKPAEAEPLLPVETAAVPEPEPEPEPAMEPEPEPEIAPPPQPRPKPDAPTIAEAPPQQTLEPTPLPKSVDLAALPEVRNSTSVPSILGAGGKAGSETSPDAGSADQASGGGLPGQAADYMALLQAWLHKHKEYPRRAQARRQEGTALLYFVMDRGGHVSSSRIQQSSGYRLLDEEVLALIRRADPLPPPPPELAGDNIKLVVPVQFFLR